MRNGRGGVVVVVPVRDQRVGNREKAYVLLIQGLRSSTGF